VISAAIQAATGVMISIIGAPRVVPEPQSSPAFRKTSSPPRPTGSLRHSAGPTPHGLPAITHSCRGPPSRRRSSAEVGLDFGAES
jgi:hypothetical protein